MDTLINVGIGIAIGAAFSKFWLAVYAWGKAKVTAALAKTPPTA